MIELQTDCAFRVSAVVAVVAVRQIGTERECQQQRRQGRKLAMPVQYGAAVP